MRLDGLREEVRFLAGREREGQENYRKGREELLGVLAGTEKTNGV